jgi:hypothetical protein
MKKPGNIWAALLHHQRVNPTSNLERGNEKANTLRSQRTGRDYKSVGGRAGKAEPNSHFKSR